MVSNRICVDYLAFGSICETRNGPTACIRSPQLQHSLRNPAILVSTTNAEPIFEPYLTRSLVRIAKLSALCRSGNEATSTLCSRVH